MNNKKKFVIILLSVIVLVLMPIFLTIHHMKETLFFFSIALLIYAVSLAVRIFSNSEISDVPLLLLLPLVAFVPLSIVFILCFRFFPSEWSICKWFFDEGRVTTLYSICITYFYILLGDHFYEMYRTIQGKKEKTTNDNT